MKEIAKDIINIEFKKLIHLKSVLIHFITL